MAMSKRSTQCVRYGVVGLGHIAQVAVLPAFAHARNSELRAIVSGDAEKRQSLGDRYGVPHRFDYDAFDACLAEVDAVSSAPELASRPLRDPRRPGRCPRAVREAAGGNRLPSARRCWRRVTPAA